MNQQEIFEQYIELSHKLNIMKGYFQNDFNQLIADKYIQDPISELSEAQLTFQNEFYDLKIKLDELYKASNDLFVQVMEKHL